MAEGNDITLRDRAAAAARDIYTKRASHEISLRLLMVEAYIRGHIAGLERASETVRVEVEATRSELD